jgi:hypothetical protein
MWDLPPSRIKKETKYEFRLVIIIFEWFTAWERLSVNTTVMEKFKLL